jgi:polyisoprenoid-binding protein YceI
MHMTNAPADLLASDAALGHWALDTQRSTVRIAHKLLGGIVTVKGGFTVLAGEGTIEPGGRVSGTIRIDAASIDTKNRKRDVHLRSADFFDVENHPDITAVITSATIDGDDLQLAAELSIKGSREPVRLPARISDATTDTVTVTVDTKIDRHRFGITWNQLGLLRGPTTVTACAVFRHVA